MTDDNKKKCQHCETEIEEDGKEYTWCPVDCLPVGGKFDARVYHHLKSETPYGDNRNQASIAKALGSSRQQVSRSIKKLLQKKLIYQFQDFYHQISYTTDIQEWASDRDRPDITVDTKTVIQAAVQALSKKAEDPENIVNGKYIRIHSLKNLFDDVVEKLAFKIDPSVLESAINTYYLVLPIKRKADEVRRHWQKSPKFCRYIKSHYIRKDDGKTKYIAAHWALSLRTLKVRLTDNEYLQ